MTSIYWKDFPERFPYWQAEETRTWNSKEQKYEFIEPWGVGETRTILGAEMELVEYKGFHEEGNYETDYRIVVKCEGKFWLLTGTYFSHCGLEFSDEWIEVTPKEKKVIVYE